MGVRLFSSKPTGAILLALCALAVTACGGGGASSGSGNTGTGGTASTTCNTSLFSGGVRDATNTELASYAQTYSGSEGTYDMSFNFTATGPATLVLGADGALTYNSAAQTVTSICYESAVPQLVVHYGSAGHVDLKTDGSFSGLSPDGSSAIRNAAASAPAAPTGVTATAVSDTQIDLSWSAVTGATGYRIYRSTTSGQAVTAMTDVLGGSTQAGITYSNTGLTASTTYYYKIVAVNATGDSAASTEVSAATSAPGGGGGGGGGGGTTGLTVPGGTKIVTGEVIPSKSITSAATISYTPLMNQNGNIIAISEGGVTATIYDYVDTNQIGFGVAQSGFSIGLSPSNGCATSQAGVTQFAPLCSSVGVTYDRAAGTVTFVNSPMYALVGTCDANCVVDGVLAFAPQ